MAFDLGLWTWPLSYSRAETLHAANMSSELELSWSYLEDVEVEADILL